MIKRVALARALALDPEIVFLDEPTSGLDPIGAGEFDELIRTLQRTLGLTVFMVTHDLDSLHTVCDRIAVLGERQDHRGRIDADMLASQHPWLRHISTASAPAPSWASAGSRKVGTGFRNGSGADKDKRRPRCGQAGSEPWYGVG